MANPAEGPYTPVGAHPTWPDQSVIRARESTANIPAARLTRDVSDRLAYIDPDAAPLTLILQKARKKSTHNPMFEWYEKDLPARYDQVNANLGGLVTDVALVVKNSRYFSVGDVVNNLRTGEKMRVTAVNVGTETLTVVRSVGSTADQAAILQHDDLQIIGNAYAEGAPLGLEKTHIESAPYNYTQIFRTPYGVTGTMTETETYIGPEKPRLRAEKAIEHKIDLERAFLFGERGIDLSSTNNPIRYTGGLLEFLTLNIKDAGGALTAAELENWFEVLFQHTGSGPKFLMASPLVASVFDLLAIGSIQIAPKESTFGVSIRNWVTTHGSLNIVKHRLLEFGPTGTQGYGDMAIAVDPSKLAYRTLGSRDTKLRMDVGTPGDDGWTDEYLTECGLQCEQVGLAGILDNVAAAA